MAEFFAVMPGWAIALLLVALAAALFFEAINGFHDTSNAVAMTIYCRALSPMTAVALSAAGNFAGILAGGLGVAFAILHILPVDLLLATDLLQSLILIGAILLGAIFWNFTSWWFGIPLSSTHSLVGAMLGVGAAHGWLVNGNWLEGVRWSEAGTIGLSLLVSPLLGLGLAVAGLRLWLAWQPHSPLQAVPQAGSQPPVAARWLLVLSALGVSLAHGSNDGQKGVGLIMLVLISIVPAQFAINPHASVAALAGTRQAVQQFEAFHAAYPAALAGLVPPSAGVAAACPVTRAHEWSARLSRTLAQSPAVWPARTRQQVRQDLLCLNATVRQMQGQYAWPAEPAAQLSRMAGGLLLLTDYAPRWVMLAVALALGGGTLVGWRRVVRTVSERIGQQPLSYAQGVVAQTVGALSIGLASSLAMPVSTTHVVTSAVAGTVLARRGALQAGTVSAIVWAWVATLPVTMLVSGGLYLLAMRYLG